MKHKILSLLIYILALIALSSLAYTDANDDAWNNATIVYTFDINGTTYEDKLGNANLTLTEVSNPIWMDNVTCAVSECICFDGVDDYLTFWFPGTNHSLNYSVMALVNMGDASASMLFDGHRGYATYSNFWINIHSETGTGRYLDLSQRFSVGHPNARFEERSFGTNWVLLTVGFNGTAAADAGKVFWAYLNSTRINLIKVNPASGTQTSADVVGAIGAENAPTPGKFFTGCIEWIMFTNGQHTQAMIDYYYNNGNFREPSAPVVDTCTPPASGNYFVDCSDNCVWDSADDIPANITLTGTGAVSLSAVWTFTGTSQFLNINPGCEFAIHSGGEIGG